MNLKIQALSLLILFLTQNTFAACGSILRGQSAKYHIEISDGVCEYEQLMIKALEFDGEMSFREDKPKFFQFNKECKENRDGFTCRKNGKSILAGTTYKYTQDTNPYCAGEKVGQRLTCVNGCAPHAPKYLYIEPYEC